MSDAILNGNLINKWKKNRELNWKFSYYLKTNGYLLGLSVTLILLSVNQQVEKRAQLTKGNSPLWKNINQVNKHIPGEQTYTRCTNIYQVNKHIPGEQTYTMGANAFHGDLLSLICLSL